VCALRKQRTNRDAVPLPVHPIPIMMAPPYNIMIIGPIFGAPAYTAGAF